MANFEILLLSGRREKFQQFLNNATLFAPNPIKAKEKNSPLLRGREGCFDRRAITVAENITDNTLRKQIFSP
ncbi:hypothetical protein CEXT_472481 [Caerostris extrusa]|uniref:Uncharacterized protein n=1 Tax=Caerostris extrusa TaxID=172846 RepID=A0AAV4X030_CAEEX|nr:hypothetical protein CEXT_472481 [Caerostris extrusa]